MTTSRINGESVVLSVGDTTYLDYGTILEKRDGYLFFVNYARENIGYLVEAERLKVRCKSTTTVGGLIFFPINT
jgi:hypothetical protein